jgi:protein TIF31
MISRVCKHSIRKSLTGLPSSGILLEARGVVCAALEKIFSRDKKLFKELIQDIKRRYQFEMSEVSFENIVTRRALPLLRSICLKVGIQLRPREYEFSASTIFQRMDVIALVPVAKVSSSRALFADEVFENGRIAIAQGDQKVGLDLLHESVRLYEQCLGAVHQRTGVAYSQLAFLCFKLAKDPTVAISMQEKAVFIFERTLGVDNPDTLEQIVCVLF